MAVLRFFLEENDDGDVSWRSMFGNSYCHINATRLVGKGGRMKCYTMLPQAFGHPTFGNAFRSAFGSSSAKQLGCIS